MNRQEPKRARKRASRPGKRTDAPVIVSADALSAAGFDPDTAADFIAHKASKKAPLTRRAWADHCREAAKAGWTAQQAAEKVMAKGWKGFEAKYVANERPAHSASTPARVTLHADDDLREVHP